MHCDALIGAPNPSGKPYPIGLPRRVVDLPGWGGTNLLPARIDPLEAIRRTATGKPMTYDEAVAPRCSMRSRRVRLSCSRGKAWVTAARSRMGQPGLGAFRSGMARRLADRTPGCQDGGAAALPRWR